MSLASFLTEPELRGLDVESPERIKLHVKILARKKMMLAVFKGFYKLCVNMDKKYFGDVEGSRVELGAGVSLFNKYYPEVKITDIKPADHLDAVIDAQKMDFEDNSVRALYGLNFFHHLPDPNLFFKECLRVLQPGGGCVLIEPYHGPIGAFMYKRLFATETFDTKEQAWDSASRGAMIGANQALSHNILIRDRKKFAELYPDIEIVKVTAISNYMRYLISGGLNFRQLWPNALSWLVVLAELLMYPFKGIFGLHYALVLRKKSSAQ
jgi:SAM-dependent methyltransferase